MSANNLIGHGLRDKWRREPRRATFDEVYSIVAARLDQGKPPYDEAWQSPRWQGDVFIFREEEQYVMLGDIEYLRVGMHRVDSLLKMLTWDTARPYGWRI